MAKYKIIAEEGVEFAGTHQAKDSVLELTEEEATELGADVELVADEDDSSEAPAPADPEGSSGEGEPVSQ